MVVNTIDLKFKNINMSTENTICQVQSITEIVYFAVLVDVLDNSTI